MALTPAQENAELRVIVGRMFNLHPEDAVLLPFLHACIVHVRAGGPGSPEEEAARMFAQLAYERVVGHALTAEDLHMLRKHRATDADPTAGDVL